MRAAKAGLNVVEVPSLEHDRIHGLSNLNAWRDGRRALAAIMRERFTRMPEPSDAWRPQFAEVGDVLPARQAAPVAVELAPSAVGTPMIAPAGGAVLSV